MGEDYRAINSETKPSPYPMNRVDDCLAKAKNKVFFSKLDARSGFSQIPVAESDHVASIQVHGSSIGYSRY